MPESKEQGKVAVITGGSRGIGLAIAQTFAASGYSVVITGRDEKRLRTAAEELKKHQAQVAAMICDVCDPASVEKLFQEIRKQHSVIDVSIRCFNALV